VRKLLAAALAASLCAGAGNQGWGQEAPNSTPAGADQKPGHLQLSGKETASPLVTSVNQRLADAIAEQLNHSPRLKNFRVTIAVQDGVADLAGVIQTEAQHIEALRVARSVAGVRDVHDHLEVAGGSGVVQAQGEPPAAPTASPFQPIPLQGAPVQAQPLPPGGAPFPPMPGPAGSGRGVYEPTPIHGTPPGFPSATQPPPMPPYAWPTYAPYNNYSRVAYPNLYPYESFPFIGPIYPFPRIPLGWRSVTLNWEDGHWWYSRTATGHDWWRIRYW
jgi:hypothetical protein